MTFAKSWARLFAITAAVSLGGPGISPGISLGATPEVSPEVSPEASSQPDSGPASVLRQAVDLGGDRAAGTRYYDMKTSVIHYDADGTRGDMDIYRVKLRCDPQADSADGGARYTCKQFIYEKPNGEEVSIPALEGWTYTFKMTDTGMDEKGQVFGIDHTRFQGLTDSRGAALGPDKSYMIYNTFIDFHGFCDLFPVPATSGKGVQHLTRIGQSVVLDASNSSPPVNLGTHIKEGSYFKNGEITLALKGLSLVDDAPCAIVEFDSGDSSFMMLMEPMPGMEVKTLGGSHYFGDIYIDLASLWPRKVAMRELVICETNVPMTGGSAPMLIATTIERQSTIKAVGQEAYERD